MQYRNGLVTVNTGSAVVQGNADSKWLTKFQPGAIFYIPGQIGLYYIQSVDADDQLTLTTPWAGAALADSKYFVTVDFSPINGLPLPQPLDLDVTRVIEKALLIIDEKIGGAPTGLWAVKSRAVTVPPASPADGDAYIVPAGSSSFWMNFTGKIAIFRRSAWLFFTAGDGATVKVRDEGVAYTYAVTTNTWTVSPAYTIGVSTDATFTANSDAFVATQKATKSYVAAQVAALVNSSPGTLDTLKELADALGDDPAFATTMTTSLGNRIRVDAVQTFTTPQKTQAQSNIGLILGTTVQAHSAALDNLSSGTGIALGGAALGTDKLAINGSASINGVVNTQGLYVNGVPVGLAATFIYNKYSAVATAAQTAFPANYTLGYVDVFQNGVKLAPTEYTATNATSIVLAAGATIGDKIEIIAWTVTSLTSPTFSTPITFEDGAVWDGGGISGLTGLNISKSLNGNAIAQVTNANAGNAAQADYRLNNGTSLGILRLYGASFTSSGVQRADGLLLAATGAGGLTLETTAAQPIYFAVGAVPAFRFGTSAGGGVIETVDAFGNYAQAVKGTKMGYTGSAYSAIQIGSVGAARVLALNIDPSSVSGGNFIGNGTEIAVPAGVAFLVPNGGATDWLKPMSFQNTGATWFNSFTFAATGAAQVQIESTSVNAPIPLFLKSTLGAGDECVTMWNAATSGVAYMSFFYRGTTQTASGNIAWNFGAGTISLNQPSDYRAKDVFFEFDDASGKTPRDLIMNIPVHIGRMHGSDIVRPMFVAHEVAAGGAIWAVHGEKDAVDENGDPDFQELAENTLIPTLWAAQRDLYTEIDSLKAENDNLKNSLTSIEARLAQLEAA